MIENLEDKVDYNDRFDAKTDYLDIYIDGARHLPENVSLVKLYVRVVDKNLNDLLTPHETCTADMSSTLRTQNFNLRISL